MPTIKREAITKAEGSPEWKFPFSSAIKAGNLIYTSGQIGADPKTGVIVPGGFEAQVRRTIDNLSAVLKASGSSLDKVIKANVYLANLQDFYTMNKVWMEYFPKEQPARTTVQATLAFGALIEIEFVALAE
jgi:2-iminobutanoate/2-iminopropanoate deaminase